MNATNERVEPGSIYRHFKGGLYKVHNVGFMMDAEGADEKVGQQIVTYQAMYDHEIYGNNAIWFRSYEGFTETFERDGKIIKRFERVEEH